MHVQWEKESRISHRTCHRQQKSIEHVIGNKRKEAEKNAPLLISMKRERKVRRGVERERDSERETDRQTETVTER